MWPLRDRWTPQGYQGLLIKSVQHQEDPGGDSTCSWVLVFSWVLELSGCVPGRELGCRQHQGVIGGMSCEEADTWAEVYR